ncbi:MAG: Ig-like domain-containing protein [Gemmatimonadales bacterium]|nr:Ig-like domain-containing protein [Gemmatimonadales bacterium]
MRRPGRRGSALAAVAATGLLATACAGLEPTTGGAARLVIIAPRSLSLRVGQTLDLVARPLSAAGDTLDVPVDWIVSDTSLAAVSAAGRVTARRTGSPTLRARVGALVSDGLTLTITPALP